VPDVLGYARVSTAEQDLEVQCRRLRDEAGAIRVFEDVASGKSFERPGLSDLLDYARPGDLVRLDTVSASGEPVFHVFGAIAHFERRLIVERSRDGIAAARARGKHPGRPLLDEEKLQAALTLIRGGLSPSAAARQAGLGRSTLYRELALMPNAPQPHP
jgi:DNA invertase Pin-like site-specific DNA recombinase